MTLRIITVPIIIASNIMIFTNCRIDKIVLHSHSTKCNTDKSWRIDVSNIFFILILFLFDCHLFIVCVLCENLYLWIFCFAKQCKAKYIRILMDAKILHEIASKIVIGCFFMRRIRICYQNSDISFSWGRCKHLIPFKFCDY